VDIVNFFDDITGLINKLHYSYALVGISLGSLKGVMHGLLSLKKYNCMGYYL
jgi:hypothetical protein